MRKFFNQLSLMLVASVIFAACSNDKVELGKPVVGSGEAYANFANYWQYYSNHLKFYKNFEAFDTDARQMPADSFMAKYSTGKYAVYKYIARDTVVQYKLEKLKPDVEENIINQLRAQAFTDYRSYQKKGKPLVGFNYVDLDGKSYTPENTRGKFVIMKFWFVGCVPCVQEMPELNEIVAKNKNRNDILFLSIALDPEPNLRKFLAKTKFDYKTVGNKKDYVADTLLINQFPTHLVIGKDGNVMGVCSWVRELKDMLGGTGVRI
ncbi:TlpA family protein disulfide reductase [Dyadobacter luticola]|nr:TlpA disulfide reductase family protein [Dyadobacter luticola]